MVYSVEVQDLCPCDSELDSILVSKSYKAGIDETARWFMEHATKLGF
jgi:hypothetical protein